MKETTTKLTKIYFFANFETDFADIESHIAVFEKMSCRFRTQKNLFFLVFLLTYSYLCACYIKYFLFNSRKLN